VGIIKYLLHFAMVHSILVNYQSDSLYPRPHSRFSLVYPGLEKPRFKKVFRFLRFFRFFVRRPNMKVRPRKSTWKACHTWYALLLFTDYSIQIY